MCGLGTVFELQEVILRCRRTVLLCFTGSAVLPFPLYGNVDGPDASVGWFYLRASYVTRKRWPPRSRGRALISLERVFQ